jgi:putative acetyltransferase
LVVAASDDQVLGHILFSPVATTPLSEAKGIGLAPVAVRVDVQSQGIGSRLIRAGLQISKELGYNYCVVLGNPAYYERFGFQKASHLGLENEYVVDDEFMVIRFSRSKIIEDHMPRRLVRYAPEFALFSV